MDERPATETEERRFLFRYMNEGADPKGDGTFLLASDIVAVVKFTEHQDPMIQSLIGSEPLKANRFVVVRQDTSLVAIVSFNSVAAMNQKQTVEAIRQAATRWALQTFEGIKAWDDSEEDFNVGDLGRHLADTRLVALLRTFGIHNLEIEALRLSDAFSYWDYNTTLITDGPELQEKLKPSPSPIPPMSMEDQIETEEELQSLSWDSGRKEDYAQE